MGAMNYDLFHERLNQLIENRGLSINDLAAELKMTGAALSRYKNLERLPTVPYLAKIAEYFNVTMDWLMGMDDERKSELTEESRELLALYSLATEDDRTVIQAVLAKYKK